MSAITKPYIANTKKTVLYTEIKTLIEQSKQEVAVEVNSTLTMLYWEIGKRIKSDILQNKRAEYGQKTIKQLSINLTAQYGKGWSEKQLRHCLRFAETFKNVKIVSALRRQLSWTHIKVIMYFDDPLQREFYIEMCKIEKWSTRDYYIDLLFFHRRLKSLVAIELKLGKFKASYKGQMELYLRWLDKNLRLEDENSPIGLILCAGKSEEHIELLQLNDNNIKVADYLTKLPDKKLLEQKLRTAIEIAKKRLEARE